MPSRSYLRRTQPHVLSDEISVVNFDHEMSKGVYDPQLVQSLYPVDPRTGFASSDLARVLSEEIPSYEKERILSRLSKVEGKFLPSELSDDDVFSLVPPRFMLGDQTNIQKWRDYLASEVLPYMSETATELAEEVVPDGNENNSENNSENKEE